MTKWTMDGIVTYRNRLKIYGQSESNHMKRIEKNLKSNQRNIWGTSQDRATCFPALQELCASSSAGPASLWWTLSWYVAFKLQKYVAAVSSVQTYSNIFHASIAELASSLWLWVSLISLWNWRSAGMSLKQCSFCMISRIWIYNMVCTFE